MLLKQINVGRVQLGGDIACCPDNSLDVCKFAFVIADLASITSITIDGNVHTIAATDETDPGDIAEAINQAFLDEGYFNDGTAPSGVTVYINEWVDTETVILIYANADTVTMTTVPAATASEYCIAMPACLYKGTFDVGALDVDISDEDVETANPADSPQNVAATYASGAADTLASDLNDALIALYASETNIILKRVKVTENLTTAKYEWEVWLYGHRKLAMDTGTGVERITKCECKSDFTALQ